MKQVLNQLMKRANNLKNQRNLVAHGLWGHMPNERLWKVFKMDALDVGLLLTRKKVTAELDPTRIAQDIRTLNSDFKKLMTQKSDTSTMEPSCFPIGLIPAENRLPLGYSPVWLSAC